METFKKVLGGIVVLSLVVSLVGPTTALAATTPSLGAAATYGVLSSTYTNTSAATTINGDVGFTTGPAADPLGSHPNYGSGGDYSTAGTDQATALSALNAQSCDFTFGSTTDLSLVSQPLSPGVYCVTGAASIGTGGITLNGDGTYIFRSTGAFTTVDNSIVTLNGASACNVFWTPGAATTLGATTTFAGNIIQPTSSAITTGANTTWTGRALAFGGTVTTGDTTTISVPTCSTPVPPTSSAPRTGTINVVKVVVNDNGRTKTISDFPLFVNGQSVISGYTNTFSAPGPVFTVTETSDASYTSSFSGDCDVNGQLGLNRGDNKFCIVTNNDVGAPATPPVPPLIDVVKVPSPLALPGGPGPVTYTYTLRNIGTVPVTNITMVGDTCSPISLVSGDTNGDAMMDVNETWVHTCTTTLTETHTNTVVATGWANGISAVDIATATVVVGLPVVPPLIHVTKVPNPLALQSAGGAVTYTEKITNPGTVPLSNVNLTDDKCGPMIYISGDVNRDSMLDTSETWTYTCRTNLTKTTVNTATATGQANGLTAKDVAVVTVVVAAPRLPNTGFSPEESVLWNVAALTIFVLGVALVGAVFRKRVL